MTPMRGEVGIFLGGLAIMVFAAIGAMLVHNNLHAPPRRLTLDAGDGVGTMADDTALYVSIASLAVSIPLAPGCPSLAP
jgi:hypothetical protein